MAKLVRFFHVMGCQKDGGSLAAELGDQIAQLTGRGRIETARRLVEEEEFGLVDQGASDE